MGLNRKSIQLLACFCLSIATFFSFSGVEAYEATNTHSFLTKEIVKLYNQIYSKNISESDANQIVLGSQQEDLDPRWINHFYDPLSGSGWLGQRLGDLPAGEVTQLSNLAFGKDPVSTLDWVHNQKIQTEEYGLYGGNRTFESAVLSYSKDDKANAYLNLGHVLHDLEDMSVPAHTRQDSHFDMPVPEIIQEQVGINLDKGEPYEKWAEQYTSQNPTSIADGLKDNYKPICNSLDECIKTLALYSNNNFYSSDSILDDDYLSPKVANYVNRGGYAYAYDKNNNLLFRAQKDLNSSLITDERVDLPEIHQAYWNKLAPETVLAGVEVVKYFFDQGDKVKNGDVVIETPEEVNFFTELFNFSPYGQLTQMYNYGAQSLSDIWGKVKRFGSDFTSHVMQTLKDLGPGVFATSNINGLGFRESPNSDLNTDTDNTEQNQQDNTQDDHEPPTVLTDTTTYTGTGGPDPTSERQEILEDIAEQLDVLKQKIQDLIDERDKKNKEAEEPLVVITPIDTNIGGSATSSVYPTILISEIQTAGLTDEKEEFIELYNPNGTVVDLKDWYIQRKTKTGTDYSTYASSSSFSGKTIPAKGYFLVARSGYFPIANVFTGSSLTDDNTLVLKNPSKGISDKVGFGLAQEFEGSPTINPSNGKSIGRKVLSDGTIKDTNMNQIDFELQHSTPKYRNVMYNAPSNPLPPPPTPPPQPPVVVSTPTIEDATVYSQDLEKDNGAYYYNLLIKWSSSNPDLDYFTLQYKLNNGEWKDWFLKTTDTQANFKAYYSLLTPENIYSFRVKLFDKSANQSDWKEIPVDLSFPVTFNEMAFFGTNEDENNQWIELYNKSDAEVDLTGWKIVTDTKESILEGSILSKGYFVLEGENIGKYVKLLDKKGRYVDQIYIPFGGWQKPDFVKDDKHYSLQRISPYAVGNRERNWKINDFTQSQQNINYQMYTLLPSFGNDTVLMKDLSPYLVEQNESIFKGITLLINSGIVINFYDANSGFLIDGTLKAQGTDSEKITFTSFKDDPLPGYWLGLSFSKDSVGSELDNTIFQYAGAQINILGSAIKVDQSSVLIKNSLFDSNLNKSLYLINSNSIVDNTKFLNHVKADSGTVLQPAGMYIEGGSPEVSNCSFESNNYGILIDKATANIHNNDFKKNYYPIFWYEFDGSTFLGNAATENDYNEIYVNTSRELKADYTLNPDTIPYLFSGILTVPENITLTLSPGLILEFVNNYAGVEVKGTLKAQGAVDNVITFRPHYYDQDWIQAGNWLGLSFAKTSKNSELENVNISYAGSSYGGNHTMFSAGIKVDQCDISLKNSVLENNANNGVFLINSNSIIDSVKFLNHKVKENGVDSAKAIHVQGGLGEVKKSEFQSQEYGIYLDKWHDPDADTDILPVANLHTQDPEDPDKNIFIDTLEKDIHNRSGE